MASHRLVWLLLAATVAVAAAQFSDLSGNVTDFTTLTPEELPTPPSGCLTGDLHPDCFTASDITAAVVGTFFLTLALVLILYAFHRLCWRVYNVKLANYAI